MKQDYKRFLAFILVFILIFPFGISTETVNAEDIQESARTIDGADREQGISQIQTVIPDYVFAGAVYDGLKRENHFGDGIRSVEEVLASYSGYIEYTGWKYQEFFTVRAAKVETATGKTVEDIEEVFLSREEAEAYYNSLVDTSEFRYLDKRLDSILQNTGMLKEDDELIHDITGIEWLRKASSINLSYNKITDLAPLDINHIYDIANNSGETEPDALTGEKWYGTHGENAYFDFRGNPICSYPSQMAGRMEMSKMDSTGFKLEAAPCIIVKEDEANKKYQGKMEIPLIERDGERISFTENSCRIADSNIQGIEIAEATNESVTLGGLVHSGNIQIKMKSGDNSRISTLVVDEWDLSSFVNNPLEFLFHQTVRIYNPVKLAPLKNHVVITLKAVEDSKEEDILPGAVFHLYEADFTNDSYIPGELYSETDYITDKDGKVIIEEELPSGSYCLIQEKAPENYLLNNTPYGFSVGGTVSLSGGTPEVAATEGNETAETENVTYIDRYSPDVSLTAAPVSGNTVERVVLTYFDREKQGYEEISFFPEDDITAVEGAQNWINSNKGDKDNLGLIDGSVSIQMDSSYEWEINVLNKPVGDLTISNTVSGNAGDRTQKFPFTITLDDTSVNGVHGELNFVDGAALFELADGESVFVKGLPEGVKYTVVESNHYGYTVTSTNGEGIVTDKMISVNFYNYKTKDTDPDTPEPEDPQPGVTPKPEDPKPGVTPKPEETEPGGTPGSVQIGQEIKDQKGNTYKVTANGNTDKTVEFKKPKKGIKGTVIIPDTVIIGGVTYKVTSVAKKAFWKNTKITKVKMGKNIRLIGANAFYGCSGLRSAVIGINVTNIESQAFYKCTGLTKITIPAKVKKIGRKAFYGCKKLKNITVKTKKLTKKTVGSKAFSGIHKKAVMKVPKSKLKTYKTIFKSRGAGKNVKFKK